MQVSAYSFPSSYFLLYIFCSKFLPLPFPLPRIFRFCKRTHTKEISGVDFTTPGYIYVKERRKNVCYLLISFCSSIAAAISMDVYRKILTSRITLVLARRNLKIRHCVHPIFFFSADFRTPTPQQYVSRLPLTSADFLHLLSFSIFFFLSSLSQSRKRSYTRRAGATTAATLPQIVQSHSFFLLPELFFALDLL